MLSAETKHAEGIGESPVEPPQPIGQSGVAAGSIPMNEELYMSEDEINIAADLTEEDKLALALK
jgi:hypothetical protein